MKSTATAYLNMNDSLARSIKAKVEHYSGSTLLETYSYDDFLQNIHVDRTGTQGKFFGFGISQTLTLKLADKERQLSINKDDEFKIYFSVNDSEYLRVGPTFAADTVKRDEKTNVITCIALDPSGKLSKHTFAELDILSPYSPANIITSILTLVWGWDKAFQKRVDIDITIPGWDIDSYVGTETLREVMDDVAEVCGAIYFFDNSILANDERDFFFLRQLTDSREQARVTIGKKDYFELTTEPAKVLHGVAHITELGDNIQSGTDTVQYIRNNPFLIDWPTDKLPAKLDSLCAELDGATVVPLSCSWRGNFATQPCDKIAIEDKTGNIIYTYILNDSYEYSGGFKQTLSWAYEAEQTESVAPTTLGEKLYQTTAKVDKVNREITLVASSVEAQNSKLAELQVTTDGISGRVTKVEQREQRDINAVNDRIDTVAKEASLKLDAEGVEIVVAKTVANGVDKVVTTAKNYTFDDSGLNISSSDSNISTTITEDGMRIYRAGEEVLTADNEGVKAEDLHATTFLIIGETSRLEDRDSRTACFWIGG